MRRKKAAASPPSPIPAKALDASDIQVHRCDLTRSIRSEIFLDARLTNTAFRALAFALSRVREDGKVTVADLMKICQVGEDGWRSAKKCLRRCGYFLGADCHRSSLGRWVWTLHFTDTPLIGRTAPGSPGDGAAGDGQPGDKSKSFALKALSLHAKKDPPRLVMGILCWDAADRERVRDLVTSYGGPAVHAAVAQWRPGPLENKKTRQRLQPLPSEILKALSSTHSEARHGNPASSHHPSACDESQLPINQIDPYYRD